MVLGIWRSRANTTDSVIFVLSHMPAEEHAQEKISEDGEKEGFDILMCSLLPHAACPPNPLHLFSIVSDDPLLLLALFPQDIYIS